MNALAERAWKALVPTRHRPLATLPLRQVAWAGGAAGSALGLQALGLFESQPEVALGVAVAAGPALAVPSRVWALPLVAVVGTLGALLAAALGLPAVLAIGAITGLATGLLHPGTATLDRINATLAGLAGAALALSATQAWIAPALLPAWQPAVTAALVSLGASLAWLPLLAPLHADPLPSPARITRALAPAYRAPVVRARTLVLRARPHLPDAEARRGLAEVAGWVFALQRTLQDQDRSLDTIDGDDVRARIEALTRAPTDDAFTRERHAATIAHLERLLSHRDGLARERGRTEALVVYALAFLEEAVAGVALSRERPGEAPPERLSEVLDRLRSHAVDGQAARQSRREVEALTG